MSRKHVALHASEETFHFSENEMFLRSQGDMHAGVSMHTHTRSRPGSRAATRPNTFTFKDGFLHPCTPTALSRGLVLRRRGLCVLTRGTALLGSVCSAGGTSSSGPVTCSVRKERAPASSTELPEAPGRAAGWAGHLLMTRACADG